MLRGCGAAMLIGMHDAAINLYFFGPLISSIFSDRDSRLLITTSPHQLVRRNALLKELDPSHFVQTGVIV